MLILMTIAALTCASVMRQWAIAADTEGSLPPDTTWTTSYSGMQMCTAAAIMAELTAALAGDAANNEIRSTTREVLIVLTFAHLTWGVRRMASAAREVMGNNAKPEDINELVGLVFANRDELIKELQADSGRYDTAWRRHWKNTMQAYEWGGVMGITLGIFAVWPSWQTAAGALMAIGAASRTWYRRGRSDERRERTGGLRDRERRPKVGRRPPARATEKNPTQQP